MENSEVQKKTINLGKLFVKEFGLEPGVDTLGRWLAHYLAEKIEAAENSSGKEKAKLEKECFETILKIWHNRWKMQRENRPFQNFEKIFDFIVKLKPERGRPFYFDIPSNIQKVKSKKSDKSHGWLDAATEVDKFARICINYALSKAASSLNTKETDEWLQNAPDLTADFDTKIIRFVLKQEDDFNNTDDEDSNEKFMQKVKVEKIKANIELLQNFSKLNSKFLKALKQDLNEEENQL